MIKKIIPIVALIGASAMIVSISNSTPTTEKKEAFINHFNSFKEDVASYTSLNTSPLTKTALNKYTLSLQNDLQDLDVINTLEETNNDTEIQEKSVENENSIELPLSENNETENNNEIDDLDIDNIFNKEDIEEISTLYSLSNDIEESCGDFCELKNCVSNAIVETQNLINKLQNKEIELNNEQRLFITEQAQQLKNLGRQLSNITTELSFNLSDINYIMTSNNEDFNNLSLKYLVVLDNLVNGNEMLQSSLTSLNLINQMFNMNLNNIPSNNQGRILYGFKHNNNPPVIKDYYINENGEMIENSANKQPSVDLNEQTEKEENNVNIDTYSNNKLNSNIDTYANNNLPNNIDSFFNTALLDNEFMYGNNGNGVYGVNNPYMQNYANHERNNTINSDNKQDNTQNTNNTEIKKSNKKEKKRFELKKNIDTFKDENEPSVKTKLGNIKNSITGFFSKFKKTDITDKVENPVYREELK